MQIPRYALPMIITNFPRVFLSLSIAAFASLAQAEEATSAFEYIFATGKTEAVPEGEKFTYLQMRNDAEQKIDHDEKDLVLSMGAEDMTLELRQGESYRMLGAYPKSVGNPVHMYFLETFIQDMQNDTGGSGFYIRNRLKDALSDTKANPEDCGDASAKCVTILPFENDEARARMGNFADIVLTFHIDEENPLWVVGIEAENPNEPDGYQFDLELK